MRRKTLGRSPRMGRAGEARKHVGPVFCIFFFSRCSWFSAVGFLVFPRSLVFVLSSLGPRLGMLVVSSNSYLLMPAKTACRIEAYYVTYL